MLNGLAVLLVVAVAAFFAAPHVLGRGRWRIAHPEACLLAWMVLFLTGMGCALAAVVGAVVVGVGERVRFEQHDWVGPTARVVVAWVALGVGGAVLSLVSTKVAAMVVAERRLRADFDRLATNASTRHRLVSGLEVHVVPGRELVVCALRRRHGEVLVSSAVAQVLDPPHLAALVAHERAHLRGWHDAVSRLAALNADCLPGFLTPRVMQQSTRLLIELCADRAAARRVGTTTMAHTLRILGRLWHADSMLLRADLLTR